MTRYPQRRLSSEVAADVSSIWQVDSPEIEDAEVANTLAAAAS